MIKPSIHLNGSNPEDLRGDFLDAYSAARRLLDALAECSPNARDYYPQGSDAAAQAVAEYRSRVERIVSVRDELEALTNHVTDEIEARARR